MPATGIRPHANLSTGAIKSLMALLTADDADWPMLVDRTKWQMFLFRSQEKAWGDMAIYHRIKPRYPSRNDEIIAKLRAEVRAGPPRDPTMAAKKKVAEVAILMALIHGGEWRVQFEPENDLILIARLI